MSTQRTFFYIALLALLCVSPAVGLAAKCAGTNINNTVTWGPSEIVKGNTLSILRFTSVIVSDDPAAPFHLVSGECVGSFLTSADGKTSASGFCARKDKDGDVLNEEWVVSGKGVGSLKLLGGTGKFAKAAGAAQWQHSPLYGTTAAVRWTGDCN
jgi:hypothetical protein